jgi:hypothetical protein
MFNTYTYIATASLLYRPLLWAPSSELYGRRNLFIFTYILFTIFNGKFFLVQYNVTFHLDANLHPQARRSDRIPKHLDPHYPEIFRWNRG